MIRLSDLERNEELEERPDDVQTPFVPSSNGVSNGKNTQSEGEEEGDETPSTPRCRYLLYGLATLACSATTANTFSFSYASVLGSPAELPPSGAHNISPHDDMLLPRSWVMSILNGAAPAGALTGIVISLLLTGKVSIRKQIMIGLMLSAVPTGLIPFVFALGEEWVVPVIAVLRFVQGFGSSIIVPLMLHLAHKWTALREISLMFAIVSSQSQIGIMYTAATAGFLSDIVGWRIIFVIFIAWVVAFFDDPSKNCCLSQAEADLLSKDETPKEPISYSNIFKELMNSLTIWAILVAAFGSYGGISPIFLFQTNILKRGLGLTNRETCVVAFLSNLMHLFFKLIGCYFYFKSGCSENFKSKLCNTIACAATGCILIGVATGYIENKYICAALIGLALSLSGFSYSGFHTAALIVARQYTTYLIFVFVLMSFGTSMLEPALIAILAPEQNWTQWRLVLLVHGIILILSNGIYLQAADIKAARFTLISLVRRRSEGETVERPPPGEL